MHLDKLVLKPKHRWFAAVSQYSEEWDGPHKTVEAAVLSCLADDVKTPVVFIAQGRKLTRAEREDFGVEFTWQTEPYCLEIHLTGQPVEHDILSNLRPRDKRLIKDFCLEVKRSAEQNMLKTGKLEGAHYAAMIKWRNLLCTGQPPSKPKSKHYAALQDLAAGLFPCETMPEFIKRARRVAKEAMLCA